MSPVTANSRLAPLLNDGVGQADLLGRAISVIRAEHGGTAVEARARLNDQAAASNRNVVVLAAEIVNAAGVAAVCNDDPLRH